MRRRCAGLQFRLCARRLLRFPDGDGPDAVRFAMWRDDGASIWVRFAIERDHHPFCARPLEYARDAAGFHAPPASGLLERQARAYIESYLRRKGESAAAEPCGRETMMEGKPVRESQSEYSELALPNDVNALGTCWAAR